jgi:hypothetical protein
MGNIDSSEVAAERVLSSADADREVRIRSEESDHVSARMCPRVTVYSANVSLRDIVFPVVFHVPCR